MPLLWLAHIFCSMYSAFLWSFEGFWERGTLSAGWMVFFCLAAHEQFTGVVKSDISFFHVQEHTENR